MRIYLTGMSGVGKTTIGKLVADHLNYFFVDLDETVASKERMQINEIFALKGERYFREAETTALNMTINMDNIVVATGGGAVTFVHNYELMKKYGKIVCLSRPCVSIWEEINVEQRPLLKQGGWENFKKIYDDRYAIYKDRCDFLVEGEWDDIVKKLIEIKFD